MKIKRHKKVHKTINFYVNNFGFRQPFQVLIDGTFCLVALKNKINIQDQLPKYLQAELKLLTTQCVVLETEELGPAVFGAMKIVKQFSVHKCGHEKNRVSGSECLKSMVKDQNKNRYIIATQDRELQNNLRTIPGVPLLYLHQTTPILEQPSDATLNLAKNIMDNKFNVSKRERIVISKLKEQSGLVEEVVKKPKRKKKKGPNPLSCLKSKRNAPNNNNSVVKKDAEIVQQKVHRKRVRIAKHIKDELLKSND